MIAPGGKVRFHNSTLIEDSGRPDEIGADARELAIAEMPVEVLPYLLNSRYCEVDLLANTAVELFGSLPRGWERVQAICDWINYKVSSDTICRPRRPRWEPIPSGLAYAAISSIWRSRSAAP